MKYLFLLALCLQGVPGAFAQSKAANDFYPLHYKSGQANYYKMSSGEDFLDYFLDAPARIQEREYFVRIRLYSWGENDTAYLRQDEKAIYSYDARTKKESILLPKEVRLGQHWQEADGSWDYEIMSINGSLKTPATQYKNLVVVSCVQRTHRDKSKSPTYLIYYAEGLGVVGAFNDGRLSSYLSEIKYK